MNQQANISESTAATIDSIDDVMIDAGVDTAADDTDDCAQGQNVCNEVIQKAPKAKLTFLGVITSEYFLYIISLIGFFGTWQWAATSSALGSSTALATPIQVLASLKELATSTLSGLTLWEHIWISTYRVILGFSLAAFVGVPLGLFMAFNETFRAIVKPLFDMFKPMPPLAWISVAILWFGVGEAPKIFIIVIGSFVPAVLNSYSCVQLIEPELYDVVRVMGGSRWDEIRLVSIKAALPAITAGLQIAMSSAWACVVAAELVNARSGLGYIITQGMKLSDPGLIIGGMVVITFVSLIFTQGMDMLSRKLCPWQRDISGL